MTLGEKVLVAAWMALGFGCKAAGLIYAIVVSLTR